MSNDDELRRIMLEARQRWVESQPEYRNCANDLVAAEAALGRELAETTRSAQGYIEQIVGTYGALRSARRAMKASLKSAEYKFNRILELRVPGLLDKGDQDPGAPST